eukprot:4880812-Pyramimonas_sp.AAC.1
MKLLRNNKLARVESFKISPRGIKRNEFADCMGPPAITTGRVASVAYFSYGSRFAQLPGVQRCVTARMQFMRLASTRIFERIL